MRKSRGTNKYQKTRKQHKNQWKQKEIPPNQKKLKDKLNGQCSACVSIRFVFWFGGISLVFVLFCFWSSGTYLPLGKSTQTVTYPNLGFLNFSEFFSEWLQLNGFYEFSCY